MLTATLDRSRVTGYLGEVFDHFVRSGARGRIGLGVLRGIGEASHSIAEVAGSSSVNKTNGPSRSIGTGWAVIF